MRAVLVALSLLSSLSRPASADATVPRDGQTHSFQTWVTTLARERGQRLVDWWAVNLDDDAALELVAVLYDDDLGFGDFLIQKSPRRRWDVRFYSDGRTQARRSTGARPNAIEYNQGHRGGYFDQLLALRNGRVAVVYEETLDDARAGDRPEATDLDALVRRKRLAEYRYVLEQPAGPHEPDFYNGGGLALRRLD